MLNMKKLSFMNFLSTALPLPTIKPIQKVRRKEKMGFLEPRDFEKIPLALFFQRILES